MKTFTSTLRAGIFGIALGGGLLGTAATQAADYTIDTEGAHASVNFRIQHLGYSWLTGRFNGFEGSLSYDPDNVAASKIKVTIDTGSIDTNHAERDKHLRSGDFLDVETFDKATFVSKRISNIQDGGKTFDVEGQLTLHGVTRDVTIAVQKVGEGEDPWGGYRVGFTGAAEIALKDFGIDYDLGPASQVLELDLNIEGVR